MSTSSIDINILVPLYNEEEVFDSLQNRLNTLISNFSGHIEVILVDDGSTDATRFKMENLSKQDARFTSVFLSRNFGHQLALTAGMSKVNARDAVFIIDGDLQDPPELMNDFYAKIKEGFDVVYAVRKKRKEGILKRTAYKWFYLLLKKLAYVDMPLDAGDFSMLSRRVVDQLNNMPEESRFLRGMRSWVGFKQVGIPYERSERQEGDSKYTIWGLMKLAFNGLFNFSEFPIRFITRFGLLIFSISFIYLLITLVKKYFFGAVPEGFTALITLVILFGGAQLVAIGVIGEYVLRIFFQVKERPLFIIDKCIRDQDEEG